MLTLAQQENIPNGYIKKTEDIVEKWKEKLENFSQSKLQELVACMLYHLQIIRFLKGDNKYREEKIDKKSDTKQEKKLLAQIEAYMTASEAFESLLSNQIPLYIEDCLGISLISFEKEDNNIENIIEDINEEDVEGNYNINQTTLI